MALDGVDLVRALDSDLRKQQLDLAFCDAYYEGQQPLRYMAPALVEEVGERISQLVINWPRLCVDAYENRSDIEAFRFRGDDSGDRDLWDMYQENGGDEQSQQVHLESLINGRGFVIVGSGDSPDATPVMTGEHPSQVTVRRDPRSRKVVAGLKRWADDDGTARASLYQPDVNSPYVRRREGWVLDGEPDRHGLGMVQVVPFLNHGRMLRQLGRSEFADVRPVADAANKMATDMMLSGEFHAIPRRLVVGMDEEDFVDEHGVKIDAWSALIGRLWMTNKDPKEVRVDQFPESDLAVFHNTIKVLAQLAAQLMFLPQDYMSFTSDNPTSADSLRSSESRLVKRVERMHTGWSGSWEDVQRLMLRIKRGVWDPRAASLETMWRDPSTPTIGQKADAVVKLASTTPPILPLEMAREELGFTDTQRARMRVMDQEQVDRSLLGSLAAGFNQPTADAITVPPTPQPPLPVPV